MDGNMGAALVGGLPGAGANIRTIVNIEAGGKTRLSGVIHALFLLAVLLGLSGLVSYIPNAVLAGILVGAGLGCIDFRGLSHCRPPPTIHWRSCSGPKVASGTRPGRAPW